jgi:hypothetical protein
LYLKIRMKLSVVVVESLSKFSSFKSIFKNELK